MKPANGSYRINASPPPTSVVYTITDAGIATTFGVLVYDPVEDIFVRGSIALRFTDATHIVAVNGAANYDGTYAPVT